jgi:hypothetical protein
MPKVYGTAEGVETIAAELIPNFHPELATARFKYVFVDKASQKSGKPVLGKVRRITGLLDFLIETDFVMEVALDTWNPLHDSQRKALVDHLLESCTGEEDTNNGGAMKWSVREPDVQEFAAILRRHGAWNEELAAFTVIAKEIGVDSIVQEAVATITTTTQT